MEWNKDVKQRMTYNILADAQWKNAESADARWSSCKGRPGLGTPLVWNSDAYIAHCIGFFGTAFFI